MSDAGAEPHSAHGHAPNRFAVVSTPERLGDDGTLKGRGVTIAFLDSGFHPHPDLLQPTNRIVAYHDVHEPGRDLASCDAPQPDEWHGTQTCVAAAGSGFLSDGVYRGLASEARIVLVKVGRGGRISDAAIEKGLAWVLENQDRLGIRVVSMSLGGDADRPLEESRVNQLAEEAVRRGMVLVAAAGNSGCAAQHRVLPPATAPSVIAVGGYDDGNDPEGRNLALYCSSFGVTADGLTKPEIIAPAMWVAAPILPGTPAYARAQALAELAATPDNRLAAAIRDIGPGTIGLPDDDWPGTDALRAWIDGKLRSEKIVGAHYQHVDGTSFAAPVVASVVAQMLEANPGLEPAAVKRILLQSAEPVGTLPPIRQGYGLLDARAAVAAARAERHDGEAAGVAGPRLENGRLVFRLHDDGA
ncbi:MAG TPA: S8 family serine peptidase, partial [Thermoanaerobaculia bacterium]|nr:S8 family serine peptidase [Thermoanaerobaculia bacterium]